MYGLLLIIILVVFVSILRSRGMTIPEYDEGSDEYPHPYIDIFKEVEIQRKQFAPKVVLGRNDLPRIYRSYVKAYTGYSWKMEPFLEMLQGAIREIMNGKYTEDDREQLLEKLMSLECDTIYYYYKSPLSLLPWGIRLRYSIHRKIELMCLDPRTYMISVPLQEYRAMQYKLLLHKEKEWRNTRR